MTTQKQLTVIDTIRKMTPEFQLALPQHIPAERFTRNALTAINSNPDLLKEDIDRRSLYGAVMKAAQDGLVLDNREAALVTFNTKDGKKVQYMPMIAGILKKMRNTGEIATISQGLVYQKEFDEGRFSYVKGDSEELLHQPILFGDKGALIGVYAVVTLKDGSKVREFMDMDQINKVRASSKTGKSEYGPWATWFEEMCLKSVLRRVSKLCPMASDLDGVFASDDQDEHDSAPITNDDGGEQPAKQTKASARVKAAVQSQPEPEMDDYIPDAEIVEEEPPV